MIKFSRPAKSAAAARRGAGFLMLVMMILLVIISATQWLVTASLANQQGESDRLRARSMLAAMNQAQALQSDWTTPLRLPIAKNNQERIEVKANADRTLLTAIWLRGDTEVSRLTRPIQTPSQPAALGDTPEN